MHDLKDIVLRLRAIIWSGGVSGVGGDVGVDDDRGGFGGEGGEEGGGDVHAGGAEEDEEGVAGGEAAHHLFGTLSTDSREGKGKVR